MGSVSRTIRLRLGPRGGTNRRGAAIWREGRPGVPSRSVSRRNRLRDTGADPVFLRSRPRHVKDPSKRREKEDQRSPRRPSFGPIGRMKRNEIRSSLIVVGKGMRCSQPRDKVWPDPTRRAASEAGSALVKAFTHISQKLPSTGSKASRFSWTTTACPHQLVRRVGVLTRRSRHDSEDRRGSGGQSGRISL